MKIRATFIVLAVLALYLCCANPVSAQYGQRGEVPCGAAARAAHLSEAYIGTYGEDARHFVANCQSHGLRSVLAGVGAFAALLAAGIVVPRRRSTGAPIMAPPQPGPTVAS